MYKKITLGFVASLMFAMGGAQATTYEVVTSKNVNKSAMSTTVLQSYSFSQSDRVNAFVTLRDFGNKDWPKVMEAQWFNCGKLVSRREFVPDTIDSHVKQGEHHVWFYINARPLGVGDNHVDIYAEGLKVGSAQFNVMDENGRAGVCGRQANTEKQPEQVADGTIVLDSDALFHFNGSKRNEMYTAAGEKVDALINRVQSEYSRVEKVTVTGYTDYLGSDAYNMNLSRARANTIAQMLIERGLPRERVVPVGRGEARQVKSCDSGLSKQALQECLAPNRRVEVFISGTKR